jgi:hypothetical protein
MVSGLEPADLSHKDNCFNDNYIKDTKNILGNKTGGRRTEIWKIFSKYELYCDLNGEYNKNYE